MCICVRQRQEYFNFLLLSAILMALSPGNVYCALQNGSVVLPEVSPPPQVTIFPGAISVLTSPSPLLLHKHQNREMEPCINHLWCSG